MLAFELGNSRLAGIAVQPLDQIGGSQAADFRFRLMDNRQGRAHHGADIHAVKTEDIHILGDPQTLLPGCGEKTHGNIMIGGKNGGGFVIQLHQGIKAPVAGSEFILIADHQLVIIKNTSVGQRPQIADLPLFGGEYGLGAAVRPRYSL